VESKIEYCLPLVADYPNGKSATFFIFSSNQFINEPEGGRNLMEI